MTSEPDSRTTGPLFSMKQGTALFVESTEHVAPIGKSSKAREDENIDACSLKVVGYPDNADINELYDYFQGIGSLRKIPERISTQSDTVLVVFRVKEDLESAISWLGNSKQPKVAGVKVKIERVVEEGKSKGEES